MHLLPRLPTRTRRDARVLPADVSRNMADRAPSCPSAVCERPSACVVGGKVNGVSLVRTQTCTEARLGANKGKYSRVRRRLQSVAKLRVTAFKLQY